METQTKLRIYVGGLGETVNEEDLRNTFSKSGIVEAVEIVRTKGRSFAYIDFVPSSDKSVAKLFSTYNGCAWKGGKLRLEKAKEHYLERLKREWADNADLSSKTNDGDSNNSVSSVGDEEALDESSQIHMYFPKFRKVKALPFKGTGKHKYSFQRFQGSAFPVHFCDCAEHAVSINTVNETQIRHTSMEDGGIHQNEINLMNSVLNKFLKREPLSAPPCISSQVTSRPELTRSDHLPDNQNHNNDLADDDDGIVINAVSGPNDMNHLLENMKKQTGLQTKMARSKKLKSSANFHSQKSWTDDDNILINAVASPNDMTGLSENMKKQTGLHAEMAESKKPQSSADVHSRLSTDDDNIVINAVSGPDDMSHLLENMKKQTGLNTKIARSKKPQISADARFQSKSKKSTGNTLLQRGQVESNGDSTAASDINAVNHEKEIPESHSPKQLNQATNSDPKNITSDKPAKGTSGSKKSSWLELINTARNSSFRLSQILPETEVSKKNTEVSGDQRTSIDNFSNLSVLKRKREDTGEGLDSGNDDNSSQGLEKKKQKSDIQRSSSPDGNLLANSQVNTTFNPNLPISNTHPFIRTSSSMKDWVKVKTALSRSLKKKK